MAVQPTPDRSRDGLSKLAWDLLADAMLASQLSRRPLKVVLEERTGLALAQRLGTYTEPERVAA